LDALSAVSRGFPDSGPQNPFKTFERKNRQLVRRKGHQPRDTGVAGEGHALAVNRERQRHPAGIDQNRARKTARAKAASRLR
jgi:hypothetical protein